MENVEIARHLSEAADLLAVQGANPFRVRAYQAAARTIADWPRSLSDMLEGGEDLTALPTIGRDLARHVEEIVATGRLAMRGDDGVTIPSTIVELLSLEGIGPKRARALYDHLGVASLDQLGAALSSGKVEGVPGFGRRTVQTMEAALARARARRGRFPLAEAEAVIAPLIAHLQGCKAVDEVEVCGSLRRRRETVGDVDILVASSKPQEVMNHLLAYGAIDVVSVAGGTRASFRLRSGLEIDVRVVSRESWGSALQYFTGSKAHSVALRRRAVSKGMKLSEYSLSRVAKAAGAKVRRIAGESEEGLYHALGLPWIPPELREDRGELEAARAGQLPDLIDLRDIRGDLQLHSDWSDGRAPIEDMVRAAKAKGYRYVAITDHSKALAMIGGLAEKDLGRQAEELRKAEERVGGIAVLAGIEVEILKDGSLDLDDEHLATLDFVLAAVHTHRTLGKAAMTKRLVAAVSHPCVHALAHPSGRLIGTRDPYPYDFDEVVGAAVEHGVALELNANPRRLDLNDVLVRRARDQGAMITINTDAHAPPGLDHMRYGIDQARRGWLERGDVLNALTLRQLRTWLRRRTPRA
ncbi:MAG: DNA polymerase/3'-5' exonuclease PolX [Gemmatimonadota bacterium]|nr:DNA polymerase/3'-5' exonuclease PolX [Gemmatimonadota bacterium]